MVEAGVAGGNSELRPVVGTEFGANMLEVGSHSVVGDHETFCDLFLGVSEPDQGEDLQFSCAELVEAGLAG